MDASSEARLTDAEIRDVLQLRGGADLWMAIATDEAALVALRDPVLLELLLQTKLSVAGLQEDGLQGAISAYVGQQLARRDGQDDYGDVPPTEAQINNWLGWLAKRMEEQDRSEFLIGELQPSWLKVRKQIQGYQILEGILGGLLLGLCFGLIILVSDPQGKTFEPIQDVAISAFWGLLAGFLGGGTAGLIRAFRKEELNEIEPTGAIPSTIMQIVRAGIVSGVICGAGGGLIGILILGLTFGWTISVAVGSTIGLTLGLSLGLQIAIVSSESAEKLVGDRPADLCLNQEISHVWSDIQKLGLATLPAIAAYVIGIKIILAKELIKLGLVGGVSRGMTGTILLAIITSSSLGYCTSYARYFSLRIMLYRLGFTPWNYSRFLDYVSELGFMQRAGGGYRFTHKSLQDYFAGIQVADRT